VSRRARLLLLVALAAAALAGLAALLAFARGDSDADAVVAPPDPAAEALNPHPVAGSFRPDDTKLASCEDRACWEQAFGNVAYDEGPKRALELFDEAIASNPEVEAGCHRMAHMIGSAALARYEGNVGKAFSEGTASCWSGYYHGILERALIGVSTKEELTQAVRDVCDGEDVRGNTYIAYQCVHGIGHGLMIRTGLDLETSLDICEQLETAWDQTSCDGGVFMENFSSSYGVESKFLRDDDPIYPCNAVEERHKLYCYLQVTDRLLQTSGYDWEQTARACAGVERNWRATCFQSYGRSASGTARLDADELLRLCAIPRGQWRAECVYGAIRDIVSNDAGGERGGRFCERVAPALRGRCFNGAGTILLDLAGSPEKHRAECARITQRYLDHCLLRAAS
jgi:hypothetical protein